MRLTTRVRTVLGDPRSPVPGPTIWRAEAASLAAMSADVGRTGQAAAKSTLGAAPSEGQWRPVAPWSAGGAGGARLRDLPGEPWPIHRGSVPGPRTPYLLSSPCPAEVVLESFVSEFREAYRPYRILNGGRLRTGREKEKISTICIRRLLLVQNLVVLASFWELIHLEIGFVWAHEKIRVGFDFSLPPPQRR